MSSRQALLQWVNELLQLNYSKLDMLGTGEAYCQIMDSIYGDIPMAKIKFGSTSAHDHANNYKLLQAIFNKHQINRNFDQQRLLKCRLQDNLEFVQWLYKFWEDNAPKGPYDAVARRGAAPVSRTSLSPSRAASKSRISSRTASTASAASAAKSPQLVGTSRSGSRATVSRATPSAASAALPPTRLASIKLEPQGPDPRIAELEAQADELEHSLNVVTTERTLYYAKLLQIEEFLQTQLDDLYKEKGVSLNDKDPQVELVRTIQSILYATAEGFETPYRPEDEPF